MVKRNLIFFVCYLILSIHLNAEKRGLIIAISDYPEEGSWPDISSDNDIPHVFSTMNSLGIMDDHISLLQNEEATDEGIRLAFEKLITLTKPGDFIYFHFSGHGQQVIDDNNDELDGLDEAIVPYNSPVYFKEGFNEGQYLIRDDAIRSFTYQVRKKAGPNGQVFIVLDSCHSGTGTRSVGKARGTDIIMAPKGFKTRGAQETNSIGYGNDDESNLAPLSSFFGASSKELNYETVDDQNNAVGSLTFALSKVISNMKSNYTFKEIFDRVKLRMKIYSPYQTPKWEGDLSHAILGGSLDSKKQYFNVHEVVDAFSLRADVGSFNNVFKGSKVNVISIDNNQVISKGTLKKVSLTSSLVELDQAIDESEENLYRIEIIENSYPPIQCYFKNDIVGGTSWDELAKNITGLSFLITHDTNPELILTSCEDLSYVQLLMRDGTILYQSEGNNTNRIEYDLKKIIKAYTQGQYLREYVVPSSKYDLSLEIMSISCDDNRVSNAQYLDVSTNDIYVDDCIKLRIENHGGRPAYFSVLDIQPDNYINLLLPAIDLGYTPEEYYLKPGESFITDFNIQIGEPYGEETLKLICSNEPLDLASILQTKGSSTRSTGHSHPFEDLFSSSFQNNTHRGAKIMSSSAEQLGVSTLMFTIAKR